MNKPNILKSCFNKAVKSKRTKDIDIAALKFIKAVEDATTYDEVLNLTYSFRNLSKAILSDNPNKDAAKTLIDSLHFMCLLKIKLINEPK